jgi:hypothetical protein
MTSVGAEFVRLTAVMSLGLDAIAALSRYVTGLQVEAHR